MRFFALLLVAVGLCEARRALLSEAEEERLERRQTSETAGYPANFFDQNASAVELHGLIAVKLIVAAGRPFSRQSKICTAYN